ncbi:MAG: ornithine cyclodeaminase family protein [Candidatus Nealsonbacteria bacterium]|nr:ornithine cyclodeaminase family protein [Candidatus Nealsonbacteria bacterium]
MLVLNQKEIKKIIPLAKMKEVINWVERAFSDYGKEILQMPAKTYLYFEKYNGDLRIMPSYSPRLEMAGTKIVNVHPQNIKKGLQTVMAVILLNDVKTGKPLAILDGTYITGLRTGATSGVATKYLAKKEAQTLGVVGAGYQSIFQIMAISKVRKIKKILVYDISNKQVEKLAKILAKEKIKIKKADLEEAAGQEIVVTATPAKEIILKRKWILPGTHINAIGADAKHKQELDPQILKTAKIVVDCWEQASHSGEINVPLERGEISEKDIYGQLGEIVVGKKPARQNQSEITIFDSTGLAIQDLYTSYFVYQKALKTKIGRKINL